MSESDHTGPERDDDALAAEYVLGVLSADERQAATQRIEQDPAFARLVHAWEGRLSPLAAGYAEVEAPASVKAGIERRLFSDAVEQQDRGGRCRRGADACHRRPLSRGAVCAAAGGTGCVTFR